MGALEILLLLLLKIIIIIGVGVVVLLFSDKQKRRDCDISITHWSFLYYSLKSEKQWFIEIRESHFTPQSLRILFQDISLEKDL